MIYGRQNLLTWFDSLPDGYVYFSLFKKGKVESGNSFSTNKDETEPTKQQAREKIDHILKLAGSGEFEIMVNKIQLITTKGRMETAFSISQNELQSAPSVQGIGAVPDGYVSRAESERIAEDKFKRLMEQRELKEAKEKLAALEKENKELDRKIKSPWNEAIAGIAPYFPGILQSIGLVPLKQVAGIPANAPLHNNEIKQTEDMNEDIEEQNPQDIQRRQQIITAFVEQLATQFPDQWESILEKLTGTLQTDPGKIKMALQFL